MECNKCKADCDNCKTVELLKKANEALVERFKLQIEGQTPVKYQDIPIEITPN